MIKRDFSSADVSVQTASTSEEEKISDGKEILFPLSVPLWRIILATGAAPDVSPKECLERIESYNRARKDASAMDEHTALPTWKGVQLPVSVVSMHGMMTGVDSFIPIGKYIVPPLSRFVALTPRNYEQSPWGLPETSAGHLEDLARALWEERHVHKQPVVGLLGHSLGGTRAMMVALKYPELVDFLIIFDIAPYSYSDIKMKLSLKLWLATPLIMEHQTIKAEKLSQVEQKIYEANPYVSECNRQFLTELFEKPNPQHKHDLASFTEEQLFNMSYDSLTLEDVMHDCFTWPMTLSDDTSSDNRQALWTVQPFTKPCLFLRGDHSQRFMPQDAVDEIPKYFPNADLELVNNAGHLIHINNEYHVQRLVRGWLQRVFRFE